MRQVQRESVVLGYEKNIFIAVLLGLWTSREYYAGIYYKNSPFGNANHAHANAKKIDCTIFPLVYGCKDICCTFCLA